MPCSITLRNYISIKVSSICYAAFSLVSTKIDPHCLRSTSYATIDYFSYVNKYITILKHTSFTMATICIYVQIFTHSFDNFVLF